MWNKNIAIRKCICASGYVLEGNKCIIKTPPIFLLVSKSNPFSIKGIDLKTSSDTMVPVTRIGKPNVIEFDAKARSIFYSNGQSSSIEMVSIKNTSQPSTLVKNVDCYGLAFDWISRNLYWSSLEKGSISVVKVSNTSVYRTLLQSRSFHPTSIVVDPMGGKLYWAHWESRSPERGKIYSTQMDGSHTTVFINTDIHLPSGLAIDYEEKRLYWSDNYLKKIQSVDFLGNNRRIEIGDTLYSPFGLALGPEKSIYFIEMSEGTVVVYNNKTGLKKVYEGSLPIYDIKLFDEESQKGW